MRVAAQYALFGGDPMAFLSASDPTEREVMAAVSEYAVTLDEVRARRWARFVGLAMAGRLR